MKKRIILRIFGILILVIVILSILYYRHIDKKCLYIREIIDYFSYNKLNIDNPYNIAIMDSGANEKTIDESVIFFKDFVNYKDEIYDDNGHGTNVTKIINELNKQSIVGYSQSYIILKVIDEESLVQYSSFLDALNWLCENHTEFDIRIICMPFGFDNAELYEDINIMEKINYLADNNVVIVTSAGNNHKDGSTTFPTLCENVLSVGSLKYYGNNKSIYDSAISRITSYDEDNNKPDFYAPGVNICLNKVCLNESNLVSGTSYSAAILTAQISHIVQNYDFNTIEELKSYLYENSYNKIFTNKVLEEN